MANPIVFTTLDGAGRFIGVWTIQPDGSGLTEVQPGLDWDNPVWSRQHKIAAYFYDGNQHLKVMNADGSGLGEITDFSSDVGLFIPFSWSPDGSKLALVYNETSGAPPHPLEGIDIVSADNSGHTQIPLGTSDATHIADNGDGGIQWSPDGSKFAYVAFNSTLFATRRLEIRYCATDGSGVTVVVSGPDGTDWFLMDWFKDSAHLLVKKVARSSGESVVYKVGLDGSIVTTIYDDPAGVLFGSTGHRNGGAALSPDESQIAIATTTGLALLPIGGGSLSQIYEGDPWRVDWTALVGGLSAGRAEIGHATSGIRRRQRIVAQPHPVSADITGAALPGADAAVSSTNGLAGPGRAASSPGASGTVRGT